MQSVSNPSQQPIAVVGVSALFPGSNDASGFWRDILQGRDLLTDVPGSHWRIDDYYDADPSAPDKTYAKRGGFLAPIDFDALGWGIPPSTLPATDTSQLLALIVAQSVLQDATHEQLATFDRSRVSVILGVTSAQELLFSMVSRLQKPVWVKALRESGLPEDEVQAACARIAAHYVPWQEASFPGLLGNVVAGRIANRLNLGGTNCVTDAACASTFSALSMAVNELHLGHSDLAIAGGVDTLNDIFMYMCFSKTPALSPSGDCRPFSDQADGTMLGEGLGMVALKRLADAERDGDRIYALLRGIGTASDGRSKSVYAPVAAGQAQALRRAYAGAGYGAETVELMEAHGTGTKAGDAAEFEGLRSVFEEADVDRKQWCALGSVKSQIGHTKAAAGAAGLFKAVMALHHKVLPPSIKIAAPNPNLDIEHSPFYLNTQSRPWIRGSAHPRRASVSAFGFGGSNFHVALEEYLGPGARAERLPTQTCDLVLLGAKGASELLLRIDEIVGSPLPLARIAHTSRAQWGGHYTHRLAVVAQSIEALHQRLKLLRTRIQTEPGQTFELPDGSAYGIGRHDGKLALLFPGQGSQYLGMGGALAMQFERARSLWDHAADIEMDSASRLQDVMFPRPVFDEEARNAQGALLTRTEWAQPAIGVHSAALFALLEDMGIEADAFGGHSFGEIMALHAAGAFDAGSALRIARRRGELMRDASSTAGAMTALRQSLPEVEALIAKHGPGLVIANHNAPQQIVVSGGSDAMQAFELRLQQQNIAFMRLPVATAFHSPLVASCCAALTEVLRDMPLSPPTRTVFGNQTAAPYAADADAMRQQLAAQIANPVRFVDMIQAIYASGVRTFVEVGPGAVLSGLVSAILGSRPHSVVPLDRKGRDGVESLLIGLAHLAAAGIAMNAARLFADTRLPLAASTTAKLSVAISGSNVGKPYPPANDIALPAPNPPRRVVPVQETAAPGVTTPTSPLRERISPAVAIAAPGLESMNATPHVSEAWLTAFQESQQQAAAAHESFQRTMAQGHAAYLKLAESALIGLGSVLQPGQVDPSLPTPTSQFVRPAVVGTANEETEVVRAAVVGAASAAIPHTAAPSGIAAHAAPTKSAPAAPALGALLLAVVAEKTGYPVDMLQLDMDLEGDLGIDSIKRVEILAAVDERAPHLPKVDRARLSALHTLREIVDYLQAGIEPAVVGMANVGTEVVRAAVVGAASAAIPHTAAPSGIAAHAAPTKSAPAAPALEALLLAVVAEKTGYPVDMLQLDMDLEGDLGIDSIKRVEILAAVDERAPHLPKVDRARLSALHTLREIVDYLQAGIEPAVVGMAKVGMEVVGTAIVGAASAAILNSAAPSGIAAHATPTTAAPTHAAPTAVTSKLGRYALELIPAPATGFAMPGLLADMPIYVTGDAVLAPMLVDVLRARGVDASSVSALPESAVSCIYLGGLQQCSSIDGSVAVNREAFQLARQLAPRLQSAPGLFVTVQDTGGSFALGATSDGSVWLAGLPALIKTCALEWPQASVKAIDVQRLGRTPEAIALSIADELLEGGGEIEIALPSNGGRFTLRSTARAVDASEPVIKPGDVVLVSGGARGVTAACLLEWAGRCRANFVLVGRTPPHDEPASCVGITDENGLKRALLASAQGIGETLTPSTLQARVQQVRAQREIRQTLAGLAAAGAQARYCAVAIEDQVALQAALDQVRGAWGPIRAIVHGAGVLADKRIAEKTDAQFARVFDTKVQGLRNLLTATQSDPLKLLCVFSSVSARCGNTGQSDYAMANEILAKVAWAESRRRPALRVKSLGWGPWEGGMVTPQLKDRFSALGVPMIPLAVGARMFADEMADASAASVELVLGGEPRAEALLFEGADARVEALDLRVQRGSHAYLEGHAVDGMPVVPVVLVAEWLARAARSFRPGLELIALHELKVLKGIRLGGFENGGDRLRIQAQSLPSADATLLQMTVRDVAGRPRYSARAELRKVAAVSTLGLPLLSLGDWQGASPYPELLFHRGHFELIEQMHGVSDNGIAANVLGVQAADWPKQDWQLDVAALDGGMQLAVLYGQRMLGGPNLPTSIATLRRYATEACAGPITASAHSRAVSASATTTDIYFVDGNGQRFAELLGVQNHALAAA